MNDVLSSVILLSQLPAGEPDLSNLTCGGYVEKSTFRVLIVDDSEPWRKYLRSRLQTWPELQVIGEASDGLEAVQKSQELQPDLILLDIGLPTLNGIEVSRRILQSAPETKIIFVSEQHSADIAAGALHTGASGYVVKSDAAGELLPAVEAVFHGKPFLSGRLAGRGTRPPTSDQAIAVKHCHEVAFFANDASAVDGYARFIESALNGGNTVALVATKTHRADVLQRLKADGGDVAALIEQGSYIPLDAADTLSRMMINNMPDRGRCVEVVGDLIVGAQRVKGKHARVAFCGEIAPTLLARGDAEGAIEIERLWDQITKNYGADTLCGYLWNVFPGKESNPHFQRICSAHSAVHGDEVF